MRQSRWKLNGVFMKTPTDIGQSTAGKPLKRLSSSLAVATQLKQGVNEITSKPKDMKTKSVYVVVAILLNVAQAASAASNDLSAALQKGLFEEEANHNFAEAIQAYQSVISRFDEDRKLAGTAVFRLGEIYRKQGKTNEAYAQYERVLREFSDQSALVTLSQSYLAVQPPAANQGGSTNRQPAVLLPTEAEEVKRMQAMIRDSPDLINARDANGKTPLHKAAE